MNEEKANEKLSEATAVLARLRETPGAVSPEDCLVLSMALSAFAVRTVRLAQERDEALLKLERLLWRMEQAKKMTADDAEEAGRVHDHTAAAAREAMVAVQKERDEYKALLEEIRAATCKATFGTKACVMLAGHLGHHTSRSGSTWPQEGYQAPRYTCPCCKQPHDLPVECAWKPLAEGRAAELAEARKHLLEYRALEGGALSKAYTAGFQYGVDHPDAPVNIWASDLGLGLDQMERMEWDSGLVDQRAARALGDDTAAMAAAGLQGPSLVAPGTVILNLIEERAGWRARALAAEERLAHASTHEADRLRGLGLLVVQGLEHQVHQGGTCDHGWCVAVRSLRALVDPGVRAATAPTLPPPPEAPRG